MKPKLLYRIASVLLVLFSIGHTLGFRRTESQWGVDTLVASMQTIQFRVQGFNRTYWDFYVGFGLFVTVFLLFAAVLSWQLGATEEDTLKKVRPIRWAFAACFAGVAVLTWMHFFMAPDIFSSLVTACLVYAAWI